MSKLSQAAHFCFWRQPSHAVGPHDSPKFGDGRQERHCMALSNASSARTHELHHALRCRSAVSMCCIHASACTGNVLCAAQQGQKNAGEASWKCCIWQAAGLVMRYIGLFGCSCRLLYLYNPVCTLLASMLLDSQPCSTGQMHSRQVLKGGRHVCDIAQSSGKYASAAACEHTCPQKAT